MANPVVHWEIGGRDGGKLRDFYSQLFDWNVDVQEAMGDYGLVEAAEGGIGGGIMQTTDPMPESYLTFYIQVDDLQAYLDKVGSLGGSTVLPPTDIPNIGAFAMFSDPAGNTLGIFKG